MRFVVIVVITLTTPAHPTSDPKFCVNYAKNIQNFYSAWEYQSHSSTHLIRWHSIMCFIFLPSSHLWPRNKTFYSLDERKFLPRRVPTTRKGKTRVPPHITTNYHTPPLPLKLTIHPLSLTAKSILSFVSIRIYADSFKSLIQIKRNLAYFECFSLEKFPSDFDSSSLRFVSVCESMLPEPIEQTFRRLLPKQGKPIVV